jgi:hypothetical protein
MKSLLIEVCEAIRIAEVVDVVCVPCSFSLTRMIVDSFLFMSIMLVVKSVEYPGILLGKRWGGGGSKNSVEDRWQRERGSGGSSPLAGVLFNLKRSETRIFIRLLRMYFPRNWEFSSALSKLWNWRGG